MTDLFEPLRSAGEPVPGLAPEEVRRRGNRLHRRRSVLQAGAGALAVAVLATGAWAIGDRVTASTELDGPARTGPATPTPAPTTAEPTPTEPTPTTPPVVTDDGRIPATFGLAMGYPVADGDARLRGPGPGVPAFDDVTVCGQTWSHQPSPSSRLAVTYAAPEDVRSRELVRHSSAEVALADARSLVDFLEACPTSSSDGGASSSSRTVWDGSAGDRTWLAATTYRTAGQPTIGVDLVAVVVVGDTVLLASEYGEGAGATNMVVTEQQARRLESDLAPLVAEIRARLL